MSACREMRNYVLERPASNHIGLTYRGATYTERSGPFTDHFFALITCSGFASRPQFADTSWPQAGCSSPLKAHWITTVISRPSSGARSSPSPSALIGMKSSVSPPLIPNRANVDCLADASGSSQLPAQNGLGRRVTANWDGLNRTPVSPSIWLKTSSCARPWSRPGLNQRVEPRKCRWPAVLFL